MVRSVCPVMRTVPVRAVGATDPAVVRAAAEEFAHCYTLAQLTRWTAAQSPPVQIAEIVTQDEYTHDVVLPFGTVFLSFDTT